MLHIYTFTISQDCMTKPYIKAFYHGLMWDDLHWGIVIRPEGFVIDLGGGCYWSEDLLLIQGHSAASKWLICSNVLHVLAKTVLSTSCAKYLYGVHHLYTDSHRSNYKKLIITWPSSLANFHPRHFVSSCDALASALMALWWLVHVT